MGVLRGFRFLPRDTREWATWFARQEIEAGIGNPPQDGYHLASLADGTRYWEAPPGTDTEDDDDETVDRWTIKEFDGDYTPSAGDEDNTLLVSISASATDLILTADVFAVGSQLTCWQYGAGQVTVDDSASGVTVRTPTNKTINEQYGSITLIQVYSNEWMIAGRMTP